MTRKSRALATGAAMSVIIGHNALLPKFLASGSVAWGEGEIERPSGDAAMLPRMARERVNGHEDVRSFRENGAGYRLLARHRPGDRCGHGGPGRGGGGLEPQTRSL